jgi:hypothetical protein
VLVLININSVIPIEIVLMVVTEAATLDRTVVAPTMIEGLLVVGTAVMTVAEIR